MRRIDGQSGRRLPGSWWQGVLRDDIVHDAWWCGGWCNTLLQELFKVLAA